jgi:hypothetical protein
MRNFLFASILAVLAAAILVTVTLGTGVDHLVREAVFDSETSFWTSIVIFFAMSIIGTAMSANAK